MTAPGPLGGWTVADVCECRCHRVGNPEDVLCRCRDCVEGVEEQ